MRPSLLRGYLPTLDGWRAVAITAVIVSHVAGARGGGALVALGHKGVELFFGLSGFLICTRLLEEHDRFGRISLRGFYTRRACRILPASFTYLVVVGLLGAAGLVAMRWQEWLACALFFRNYVDGHVATNQFWSLAVEEHFYVLWPPVLVLFGLKRARWIAVLIALSAALWRGWLLQTAGTALEWAHTGVRIDSLVCGCLVALLAEQMGRRGWAGQRYGAVLWTGAVLMFVLMTGSATYPSSSALLKACLVPLIIFGTVRNPDWFPSRLLELRPLRWIGQISYSLYLWNIVIISPPEPGIVYGWPAIAARVLLTFLVSWSSYRFIEKPLIRLGHRLAPPASAGRSDLAPQPPASLGRAAQVPL